jgi:predicted RNase H-like HicB family nuclease
MKNQLLRCKRTEYETALFNTFYAPRDGEFTLDNIKYELIIYWSEVDQYFIVEVPELPGCMADGETYQEAVQNAEVVIQEWIETAQELGRTIPEHKGRLLFA